ncbi:MAG: 2-C-methyl-D-erythritol 4-phosphate cytidylyltransferase [Synergistetes bacterium]|nr:2-C-methyl-D-erythritol 4-phosphate cytidylyltransferase [Synergistota bacterium]
MKIGAILLAAGKGTRANLNIPKQFIRINGKEMWEYSFEIAYRISKVEDIIVVTLGEWIKHIEEKVGCKREKSITVIEGGNKRQESVYNALKFMSDRDIDVVAIHDTARPMVSENNFIDCINMAITHSACTVVSGVVDTMVIVRNDSIEDIAPRLVLYHVQTPQCFQFDVIWRAHNNAREKYNAYTDDATLVLKELSMDVKVVKGNRLNIKVTSSEDIELVKYLMSRK